MVCEESLRHVGEVGSLLLIWLSEQPHNELNKHGSRCEVGDVGDRARDGFEQLRHVAPIERRAAGKEESKPTSNAAESPPNATHAANHATHQQLGRGLQVL